jgi:hypothetical protein
MFGKERLQAIATGRPVDRIPVNFYEIDGFTQNPDNPDPFNIYSHPSWRPLLQLAREKTDVMANFGIDIRHQGVTVDLMPHHLLTVSVSQNEEIRETITGLRVGAKTLTSRHVVERDIDTSWCTEHLIKDLDDFKSWLELPEFDLIGEADIVPALDLEARIGEHGVVLIGTPDPLCLIAQMMDMGTYTIIAMTEPDLFQQALDRAARYLYWRTEKIAAAMPGRFWRICGPEYASPPYLPPSLFYKYVVGYDRIMTEIIHRHQGFVRIHSHGRLRGILEFIVETGCDGLDPIEPPPQGDMELSAVHQACGRDLVLFGNLEASDIENLPESAFREKVRIAITEGRAKDGRGFVLQPSASPYGRTLSLNAMRNYEAIIKELEQHG